MMSIWNARASELKQQGVPVEVVWNGAVRSTSTWWCSRAHLTASLRGN